MDELCGRKVLTNFKRGGGRVFRVKEGALEHLTPSLAHNDTMRCWDFVRGGTETSCKSATEVVMICWKIDKKAKHSSCQPSRATKQLSKPIAILLSISLS